ncbi:unnamed protein product [Closterium sp. NIES-54]
MRVHRRIWRTNRRDLCSVSPPPPGHEVQLNSHKNPFTQDGEFVSHKHEQDWDLPIPLLKSLPHDEDFINSPSIHNYFYGHYTDTKFVDNYRHASDKRIPFRNTMNFALSAQNRADANNMWYLDSCCGQHMVGSKRFISNACRISQPTVVTVANNQQLKARECGIVVLKAHNIDVHTTFNDVLIIQDLK